MSAQDTSFSNLVSLACHDLRTPLATVTGFAKTMVRMDGVDEKITRYLGMIDTAGGQLADLLEELALVARIEGGRWDPAIADVDSLQLARAAAEPLGEAVDVGGVAAQVVVARDDARRALEGLTRCALRHGGLERVTLTVDGTAFTIAPVTADTAAICLGLDLRDLGAAVAVRVVDALRGSTEAEGETLVVRFPAGAAAG